MTGETGDGREMGKEGEQDDILNHCAGADVRRGPRRASRVVCLTEREAAESPSQGVLLPREACHRLGSVT
eukprot:SAG11_NODE_3378_length_2488_cov_11.156969_3_plen_70_part_00